MTTAIKRNSLKRYIVWILITLSVCVFFGVSSVHADNSSVKGKIVMSVEKATIGQGFIMEPQYVDFYDGDTLATITLRQLTKIGRRYNYDGRIQSGFYLSEISDPGRGAINVPEYIQNIMKKSGLTLYLTDNTPEYLGEKDYSRQSGWVYDYNGIQPNVSACEITPRNGDVLQWKFTMATLGSDVEGDTEYFNQNKLVRPDRVKLNKLLAEVKTKPELMNNSTVKASYDRCIALTMNLRTSRSDLTSDMNVLRKALNWNTISSVKLWGNQANECTVRNGTKEEDIYDFPKVLSATQSDGRTINVNVISWYCEEKYTPSIAGDYVFYPIFSDAYIVSDDTVLPKFTVHVRKFGDTDEDGQVDEKDLEKLLDTKYFGESFSQDEEGAVCDLNFDGKVNLQDYSLLVGKLSGSEISSEDDGRLVLKHAATQCKAGEETTADLMLYSGMVDTVGIQLNTSGVKDGISLKCHQDFQIEYKETNENGVFIVLGRRSGALRAQSIKGTSIGTLTFNCVSDGAPALTFGTPVSTLSENQAVLGYRNGYSVSFQTDQNFGTDTRFLFQLNDGRVRTGQIADQDITEDGISMKQVQVEFRATDAEDTKENRVRVRAQLPANAALTIGGKLENGEIKDLLSLHDDGIYYAEGESGCFSLGQSAQREDCVLYGLLKEESGKKTYYRFQIARKGYAKTNWIYTGSNPLILDTWSQNDPEVLSGKWNLDDLKLQGWDADGNKMTDLHVVMPADDSTQDLYYRAENDKIGTLYARAAGDYWLEIQDKDGNTRGKVRVTAVYPYDAATYYINKAKEISLESGDYNASVKDRLFEYKDLIDKAERIQNKYKKNAPLYFDGLGRYTAEETATRATDAEGCEMYADFLRTDVVNNLRQGISEIRPVLEANKYVPAPEPPEEPKATPTVKPTEPVISKQDVIFTGAGEINREFARKSFNLGVKANTNGKVTYASSNTKVATVSASGKVTMKNMGRTVITIRTAETDSFNAGVRKITVNLNPKKPTLGSVKSSKKKTLTVRWKKVKNISGYQIQFSTSKNFKGAKTVKASAKAVSGTAKKLKSKKKYYVRIRTFKKAYGQTVYSGWSKVKQVKVK